MAHKVFSIVDFKAGLDVRKTPLTAPGGSLRILENAVLNQGGEIEKRQAFTYVAQVTTDPPAPLYMIGYIGALQVFGPAGGTIAMIPPLIPHNIVYHPLMVSQVVKRYLDVEPFDTRYFVCMEAPDGQSYCSYDDIMVSDAAGALIHGTYARTWKSKVYRTDDKYLRFSGVNNPAVNDPASVSNPGAGFINLSINDPEGEDPIAMEIYYSDMAIFARLQTQIWSLDPDPTKDSLKQLLRIGLVSPRSVLQFGTGDVLFLSDSGVRSLKAQALNNAASVSDVGSAIDQLLIPVIRSNPTAVEQADAIVQPIQGRYWLAIDDTIYVLSYFPAGHITAWSTFKPGFTVKCFAVVGNYLYVLDTLNRIWLYGGVDRNTYDSSKVTVRTPHLSADSPTQNKRIKSIDVMCQGQWSVQVGMLANNTDLFELAATVQDNTYGLQSIPFAGYGTHIGCHLEHQAPGPATLASLHFNIEDGVTK